MVFILCVVREIIFISKWAHWILTLLLLPNISSCIITSIISSTFWTIVTRSTSRSTSSARSITLVRTCGVNLRAGIQCALNESSVSDWSQNMCSNGIYLIWFMHHKTLKSSDLIKNVVKALAMSLTCILDIYLRFKEKKCASWITLDFERSRKGLNKEMGESRLMDYDERQVNMDNEAWRKFIKLNGNLEHKIWW